MTASDVAIDQTPEWKAADRPPRAGPRPPPARPVRGRSGPGHAPHRRRRGDVPRLLQAPRHRRDDARSSSRSPRPRGVEERARRDVRRRAHQRRPRIGRCCTRAAHAGRARARGRRRRRRRRGARGARPDGRVRDRCATARGGLHRQPIRNVVNIGIGGSDLGPAMAYDALRPLRGPEPCVPVRVERRRRRPPRRDRRTSTRPRRCSSSRRRRSRRSRRSPTRRTARDWLLAEARRRRRAVARHFVAVSTNAEKVAEFGIDTANMFEFWDWVGGRYSMWSAIGLSLMIAIGPDDFRELLAGSDAMDEHFRTAPLRRTCRVLMALLGVWYRDFLDAQTHAVVPYARRWRSLPSYLQQLEMESNGKSVQLDGSPVTYADRARSCGGPPAPTVSTRTSSCCTRARRSCRSTSSASSTRPTRARRPPGPAGRQPVRAGRGARVRQDRDEVVAEGVPERQVPPACSRATGRRRVLLADQLTPRTLGALVAAYEHKVMTLGTIWGIDSFDQWGVELGKVLATPDRHRADRADRRGAGGRPRLEHGGAHRPLPRRPGPRLTPPDLIAVVETTSLCYHSPSRLGQPSPARANHRRTHARNGDQPPWPERPGNGRELAPRPG